MTATEMVITHEWRLVAPWWHWPLRHGTDPGDPGDPGDRRAVRVSRPALQMYDSPDLVNVFLADPQRRLAFDPGTDEVWDVAPAAFGTFPQRKQTCRRKLFLATHHRNYLVVCSLHCNAAGFPRVKADEICQAGLVVRRRRTDLPGGPRGEIARALRQHAVARDKRAAVERRLAAIRPANGGALRSAVLEGRLRTLRSAEQDARDQVLRWTRSGGKIRHLEGWIPAGIDATGHRGPMPGCGGGPPRTALAGAGSWQPVEELPETLTEAAYPLNPLVPDPTVPGHDAAGQTIYFGLIPTGSSDVDDAGQARFDDRSYYEIRCFVRRHRPECPRSGPQCHCPVTWSEPTETYQLASHFDLEGTANRPVTVQLPDLAQLHADAVRLSPAGSGGVRFQSPPRSQLSIQADDLDASPAPNAMKNSGFQVCSFAIPLITIVAFFVFQLFLPIVVFIFQLWFLLTLRFCIPPDVTPGVNFSAELDAIGGGTSIDVGAVAAIEGDPATLYGGLTALLGGARHKNTSMAQAIRSARESQQIDTPSFGSLLRGVFAPAAVPPRRLMYVPRVERSEVVRP
ncbi:MAG TPA: hypothetical protein VFV73_15445 [Streptosporangiaceae bacterium]|nr:hypothetical protein [Streptosporangiaceae bacterium]